MIPVPGVAHGILTWLSVVGDQQLFGRIHGARNGVPPHASNEPLIDIHSRENNYGLDRTG